MEHLIGKNILEVIVELSSFKWRFKDEGGRIIYPSINTLIFVNYQKKPPLVPKFFDDTFGDYINKKNFLENYLTLINKNEDGVGLISKVILGKPYKKEEYKFAHIPFIDFDADKKFDFLTDEELLELIKKEIKIETQIQEGIILKSSPNKRNYFFIGLGTLLNENDFETFLGLYLLMKHENPYIPLVDPRCIGHSLSPMNHIGDLNNWSRYDFKDRFSTLRLNPKNSNEDFPKVVDYLE